MHENDGMNIDCENIKQRKRERWDRNIEKNNTKMATKNTFRPQELFGTTNAKEVSESLSMLNFT